ncbi:penicillin amidase [Microbacterium mangrovi]|uniref:Penicillin amidase n=2 Tax=Microbacterium mangrovi TaxID=1348253 RepID=A0A0B2A3B7_9MICO|nr:penicillin acylase family protein [Microbacterium mangrovi]KHK96092.1 penicillin amidase [Microbacterium mangrovi]
MIAVGAGVWAVQASFPQLDGTVTAAGLHHRVSVLRDANGIPTIQADDAHDLFYAQGFVHAQDRFFEMDFRRHVTAGRLSELFGSSQLVTDKFLRTLGWRHVAEQEVALLDPTAKAYYQAYADGVNAYLKDHSGVALSLEYGILGIQNPGYTVEKWTIADSLAWLKAMAWDLRSNLDQEVDRALVAPDYSAAQLAELWPKYPAGQNPLIVPELTTDAPAPSPAAGTDAARASVSWKKVGGVVEAASLLLGRTGEGVGSNSWVVSGDLTASGMPLLSNDPHLGESMPGIWHQVDLKCRVVSDACPFDVAGYGFSGMPGVIIGHNARIAWGFTNLTTDVTDLYLEKVRGDTYLRDGKYVPLQTRTETFKVAGGPDQHITVRSTGNGPIISDVSAEDAAIAANGYTGTRGTTTKQTVTPPDTTALALKWTALSPGTTATAIFALDVAKDFAGFRHAASLFDVPAQNLIYADTAGNIGYQTPGKLPIRGLGDGSMPQPGWDSAYDWKGFIPFAKLPVVYNPSDGYIVTANNAIVSEKYPYFLTNDWDYGWRAARIAELIGQRSSTHKLTVADMSAIQADSRLWLGKKLIVAYRDVHPADAPTAAALKVLQQWDGFDAVDSAGAAYANVLWDELGQDVFARREHPIPTYDQDRLFLVIATMLDDPQSEWWNNPKIGVAGKDQMLQKAATDAAHRIVKLQGPDPRGWRWGDLHRLTLTNATFGSSGIPALEWIFNRGPFPVAGGTSVVDATAWDIGSDFSVQTLPSMRMIVDLKDFDRSRWIQLTGESAHVFHDNYDDQFPLWQTGRTNPWPFSKAAVTKAATDTLTLEPAPGS